MSPSTPDQRVSPPYPNLSAALDEVKIDSITPLFDSRNGLGRYTIIRAAALTLLGSIDEVEAGHAQLSEFAEKAQQRLSMEGGDTTNNRTLARAAAAALLSTEAEVRQRGRTPTYERTSFADAAEALHAQFDTDLMPIVIQVSAQSRAGIVNSGDRSQPESLTPISGTFLSPVPSSPIKNQSGREPAQQKAPAIEAPAIQEYINVTRPEPQHERNSPLITPELREKLLSIPLYGYAFDGSSNTRTAAIMRTPGMHTMPLTSGKGRADAGRNMRSEPAELKTMIMEHDVENQTLIERYRKLLTALNLELEEGPSGKVDPSRFNLQAGDYHFMTEIPLEHSGKSNSLIICSVYPGKNSGNDSRPNGGIAMLSFMFETSSTGAQTLSDALEENAYVFPAWLAMKCGTETFDSTATGQFDKLVTLPAKSVTHVNLPPLSEIFADKVAGVIWNNDRPFTPWFYSKDDEKKFDEVPLDQSVRLWKANTKKHLYPNGSIQLGGQDYLSLCDS